MTADEPDADGPLTTFQVEVARALFTQPGATGFLLAGGAALAAHGLTAAVTVVGSCPSIAWSAPSVAVGAGAAVHDRLHRLRRIHTVLVGLAFVLQLAAGLR